MLQCLSDWRARCSDEQLAVFELALESQCTTAITKQALKSRYAGSYHKALISAKVLRAASETESFALRPNRWSRKDDAGVQLLQQLVKHFGSLAVDKTNVQASTAAAVLLQRGVIFEHEGHYCLPAECLVELRKCYPDQDDWLTTVRNTPASMLHQIVPANVQAEMLLPKASHNELVAWLIVHAAQARKNKITEQLNASDWSLLLLLDQCNIDDFDSLKQRYPELPEVEATQYSFYDHKTGLSARKALERRIPAQLIKLFRLGLIGIMTYSGDNMTAIITLTTEAEPILQPHLKKMRQKLARQLKEKWQTEPCKTEYPSLWGSMDHDLWRLWVTLHFLPVSVTQQGKVRKADMKRISSVLQSDDLNAIEVMIVSLLHGGFLEQDHNSLIPSPIQWTDWRKTMRAHICKKIRSWDAWDDGDEKQALKLLAQLPTHCWLKLDEVTEWLRTKSQGNIISADWMGLFTQCQTTALHHINVSKRCIYLLPEFRMVLQNKPVTFKAPGWYGADNKAKVHGFISAAGEIQLPPDCNHKVLAQLAECCRITAIEQMITLQLDDKAIQRMATDKAALKKTRLLLESLQSPLPQAIAYMFDKQQSQSAIAQVASTAMVIVLSDASAMHKLHKTGFEFAQPFKDRPELVLLDASADALAFTNACNEAGILLDTLIKPVAWISGMAAINAWMDINIDREDQWLEISYQKTRSSKPRQIIARIDADYYGAIRIQPTRKTKQTYTLLKSTVQLQPKHVLRLRELGDAEVSKLGLDRLGRSDI